MSFFNNMGNNIDIANVKVSKYLDGTPKMDKWKKKKADATIDSYAETMSEKWKDIYKREAWRVISKGLTEDMFDNNGDIDPDILKILKIKLLAFNDGWDAVANND